VRKWEKVGEKRVFQGAAQVNLDAKGRMAVPTRTRDPLTQGGTVKLVLTAHPDGCLLLYPAPAWEPIRAQVMSFPSLDRQFSVWKRLLVGFAQDVERFKISEYVRVNNIANVNYVGSVIVGDTSGRYYEPAPGRNWYAGVSVSAAF